MRHAGLPNLKVASFVLFAATVPQSGRSKQPDPGQAPPAHCPQPALAGSVELKGPCALAVRGQSLQFHSPADDELRMSFFPVGYDERKWGIDPNSLQLGGASVPDYPGQGAPSHARGAPSSLTIHALPYGNYDAAAALSIQDDAKRRESSRDGIGAALERGDASGPMGPLSSYPDTEAVNLYSLTHSADARLILHDVTYDAHHIYPHPALTPAQLVQLRYGMNVTTNSVDPAMPAAARARRRSCRSWTRTAPSSTAGPMTDRRSTSSAGP